MKVAVKFFNIINNGVFTCKVFNVIIFADEIKFTDDGWFSLWVAGKCIASAQTAKLHAAPNDFCADIVYDYVNDNQF